MAAAVPEELDHLNLVGGIGRLRRVEAHKVLSGLQLGEGGARRKVQCCRGCGDELAKHVLVSGSSWRRWT